MISPLQRPLPDNTQHSQHKNIQALGGIRTHDCSRRAAVDLRLRPRDHWDRLDHLSQLPLFPLQNKRNNKSFYKVDLKKNSIVLLVLTAFNVVLSILRRNDVVYKFLCCFCFLFSCFPKTVLPIEMCTTNETKKKSNKLNWKHLCSSSRPKFEAHYGLKMLCLHRNTCRMVMKSVGLSSHQ